MFIAYIARPEMCYIVSMRFSYACVYNTVLNTCTEKAEEFLCILLLLFFSYNIQHYFSCFNQTARFVRLRHRHRHRVFLFIYQILFFLAFLSVLFVCSTFSISFVNWLAGCLVGWMDGWLFG